MNIEPKVISAEEFDRLFDEGSDEIDQYIDWNSWRRVNEAPADNASIQAVAPLTLPDELVRRVDLAAERANVSRDELAARLITEGLDRAA